MPTEYFSADHTTKPFNLPYEVTISLQPLMKCLDWLRLNEQLCMPSEALSVRLAQSDNASLIPQLQHTMYV